MGEEVVKEKCNFCGQPSIGKCERCKAPICGEHCKLVDGKFLCSNCHL